MSNTKEIEKLKKRVTKIEKNETLFLKLINMVTATSEYNYQLIKRFHNVARKGGEKK